MHILLRRKKLGLSIAKMTEQMVQGTTTIRNDKPIPAPDGEALCFRWGCTSNVPNGYKIVNKAKNIHLVNNKLEFRKLLEAEGLCTDTWYSLDELMNDKFAVVDDVIIRPAKHSQAKHLYRATTLEELQEGVRKCEAAGMGGYYINKFVKKSAEYRVFIANGRVVWVAQKTPADPNDVAWNVAKGGRFDNVRWGDWPLEVLETAVKAHTLSGLDFSGVDIMVDEQGGVYVLEINSAPSQTSPYRQSCTAKAFDYMATNGVNNIDIEKYAKNGWRKYIHPALHEEAIAA